jgi:hypothetical protein
MTSDDPRAGYRRLAFTDRGASGLGSTSFPTEIGWAIIGEDGSVESGSCLIRPPAKWTMYGNAWPASERLTGITGEMLDGEALTSAIPFVATSRSVAR